MTQEDKLGLFRTMYRIRSVEEEIARRYPEGKMRCPVHLSIGQESVPALFAEHVRPNDFAVSTHRGHAHYLAKGGDLAAMIAELHGKATGCAHGKGGSMHLIDLSVNFMGTSAIVGNSIPVGVGLALSAQLQRTEQVSCIFLGDGATEEGVFYESLSFATLRQLPVIFICENNLYSVYSPLSVRQPAGRDIAALAAAIGATALKADGNDLAASGEIMARAFAGARAGAGPFFLEFSTYRWLEHCGHACDDQLGYRPTGELKERQSHDPLAALIHTLGDLEPSVTTQLEEIKISISAEIASAFTAAEAAPFPAPSEAHEGVYA
jgi:TPP-dependent pyruvate/acetoin dehydrogenase alpha subunit